MPPPLTFDLYRNWYPGRQAGITEQSRYQAESGGGGAGPGLAAEIWRR
jgi:hypothetical protein